MFSGIVLGTARVVAVKQKKGISTLCIQIPREWRQGLEVGASVAIDGVCLTATELQDQAVSFDVIQETLLVTSLSDLTPGQEVNVERSLRDDQENGGHHVSGHVDTTALIHDIETSGSNYTLRLSLEEKYLRYLFPKGFVALNGVSLTVGEINRSAGTFCVYLIPETVRRTSFVNKSPGSRINIEFEKTTQLLVDTVTECLEPLVVSLSKSSSGELVDRFEASVGSLVLQFHESIRSSSRD